MIFDAHFHVIDRRFPLVANHGYLPEPFTADDYAVATAGLDIVGGAVVSASFQGFDQSYLIEALTTLGPSFVGVTQLPGDATEDDIAALAALGVRAARVNLRRGGPVEVGEIEHPAVEVGEVDVGARHLGRLVAPLHSLGEHRHPPMLEGAVVVDGRDVEARRAGVARDHVVTAAELTGDGGRPLHEDEWIRVVRLVPVVEQEAEVGEHIAQRPQLPVENRRDGPVVADHHVADAVVAVHDPGVALRWCERGQAGGERRHRRQFPRGVAGPHLGEPPQLTLEEPLAAGGNRTGLGARHGRRRIVSDVGALRDLAVLHDDESCARGAGLGPDHAGLDEPRQPDRTAPRERATEREPLQGALHELRRPCRDAEGLVFDIHVMVPSTLFPEAGAEPQPALVRAEITAR